MAAVRVLHEIQISPSPPLPSQPPQPLSFLDAMWLQSSQLVERLFFYEYPHPTSYFIDHELPIFTNALSLTLRHFYPLAGSIRRSPDSDDQFVIAYEEGDSVTTIVAEFTGDDFRKISGHHPRNLKNLRLLVPELPRSSSSDQFSPISIQITLFSKQGICISFAINHAACDGSGSMQFIRSLAAACCSTKPALNDVSPPFLDRSIIIDRNGIQQKIFKTMLDYKTAAEEHLKKEETLPVSNPSLVHATFTLFKDQIVRLKEQARTKGAEDEKPSFHLSAFVVTCAYVWRCLAKAQDFNKDIKQYFACVVDWRSRMRPPVPSNYFGNCLGACMTQLNLTELVGNTGIEVAAMEIGMCIDGLQGRDVGDVLLATITKYSEAARSKPLSVAGSPRLRVYDTDFGWGRPVKVDITSIFETGAISLAESREEDGGIEIGLVLSEEDMKKFDMNFATTLLDL